MKNYEILSPLPGTFYRKPSPESPEFKKVGDKVSKGDVIGLVEVMKMFSEVQSEFDGVVEAYFVNDEDEVEAGQILMTVRTS